MIRNIIIVGISLFFSGSVLALDLQREELLNLYHGVELDQGNSSPEWVNLSTGIAPNYQEVDQEEIKFSPLPEPKTQFGVFTSDSLHEEISENREFEFTTPTQFGHNEKESYGVYIKKQF